MILRAGFQTFEFQEGRDLRFATADDALSWLKHLGIPDADLVSRFRSLVSQYAGDPENARYTDNQVLERLSVLLYLRRIVVLAREERTTSAQPAAKDASTPPAFPLAERASRAATTSSTPPPPANDPATFSPNVDPTTQAAALVTAAVDGTPFCLECMKAAMAAAGSNN